MFAKEIKRTGRGKSVYDFRALSFCGCCCGKCYAIERHFRGKRYKVSPIRFSRPESLANQGIFRAYCVTGVRLFLMRSAACLRVIRFRQSGQYLTLLELDAKDVPHSVHFFLSPGLVKLRIEQLISGKHRNLKPLAEKRIGNELRTYALVPVVQ